jgi:hypothetical protein
MEESSGYNQLTKKLFQSYFEVNGSFDGIKNTKLVERNDVTNDNLEEFCYNCLGYETDMKQPFTAKELFKIRCAVLADDVENLDESIKNRCPCEPTKEMLEEFLESIDLPVGNKLATVQINSRNERYTSILADYLKNTFEINFKIDNVEFPVCKVIESCKTRSGSIKSLATQLYQENLSRMTKFSYEKGIKNVYISENVFHVDKDFTENTKKSICIDALRVAIMGKEPIANLIKKCGIDIFTLSFGSPLDYMTLLEFSHNTGRTLKELMKEHFINVPDCVKTYESLGFALCIINDRFFMLANEGYSEMRKDEFAAYLQAKGLAG